MTKSTQEKQKRRGKNEGEDRGVSLCRRGHRGEILDTFSSSNGLTGYGRGICRRRCGACIALLIVLLGYYSQFLYVNVKARVPTLGGVSTGATLRIVHSKQALYGWGREHPKNLSKGMRVCRGCSRAFRGCAHVSLRTVYCRWFIASQRGARAEAQVKGVQVHHRQRRGHG